MTVDYPTADEGTTTESTTDGGLDVREFRDVKHSDDLVRSYKTPPGERLYAYPSEDGEHHIVVSRGQEPGDQWVTQVPAERKRVVPGQHLWTIPDNWEQRVVSRRENIRYALYYIPDTDTWAKVSIPTNDWLVDAWYGVQSVGDLDADFVGDVGDAADLYDYADSFEDPDEEVEPHLEAVREVARHWDLIEEGLELDLEWMLDEGPWMESGEPPEHVDEQWVWERQQDYVFRPGEVIKSEIDLPDGVDVGDVMTALRQAGVLPDLHSVELVIDEEAVGMEHYTRALEEAGCTPPETLDYYWVEIAGLSQSDRADERGVTQATVSGNVSDAKKNLGIKR